jgi:hypothetical protein
MIIGWVECDHVLVGDEEHLYKGKSYCDDCYKMVKSANNEKIDT